MKEGTWTKAPDSTFTAPTSRTFLHFGRCGDRKARPKRGWRRPGLVAQIESPEPAARWGVAWSPERLEQAVVPVVEAAHLVVIEQQAANSAVHREGARLRLDLLRSKYAGDGGE
jgi:hypothetical protein